MRFLHFRHVFFLSAMRISDPRWESIRISDQLELSRNDWFFTKCASEAQSKAKICQKIRQNMDDTAIRHLQNLYGMNPSIPHMALQFPRLPPGLLHPMFKIYENPTKEEFAKQASAINQRLQGFQRMYQQHAAGLLTMNSAIIPPGHPLYTEQATVRTLQAENDKLLKENLELKKRLDKESEEKS